MQMTEEVASLPVTGAGAFNVNIDAAVGVTLPTTAQRGPKSGQLQITITIETQNARYTWNGTAATASNGLLLTAPATLMLRGEKLIQALSIIGTVAGSKMNYQYTIGATA